MENKLPYYMMYPVPERFDEEKISQTDLDYMKSIYPKIARMILPLVEEACDREEYEGSLIYDQYPDKLLLRLLCSRVYKDVVKHLEERAVHIDKIQEELIREMVEVILYQELCRRRRDKRRRRRVFY